MGIQSVELATWDVFARVGMGSFLAGVQPRDGNVRWWLTDGTILTGVMGHLHSGKEVLLPGGSTRYDTTRNERHHADKAWSQMLAYWGVTSVPKIDFSLLGCVGRRESALALEEY